MIDSYSFCPQSNILLSRREDGSYQLRLADFGIAKIEQIRTRASTQISNGAPRWMAPEILDPPEGSSGAVTTKSDVYALSMTCVEVRSFSWRLSVKLILKNSDFYRTVALSSI